MIVADRILALDVGGTKVLGGLLTTDLAVTASIRRPSGGAPGAADPGLSTTAAVAAELIDLATDRGDRIVAVGAGFPEYVSRGLLTSTEVLDWRDQPRPMLAALAAGAPVTVESDVRCAAAAEYLARFPTAGDPDIGCPRGDPASLGSDSMLYVSWGTGLSSTLVLEGRCLAGARGEAIAVGEWEVSRQAGLDVRDTLESFASGAGIARRYRELSHREVPGAAEVLALAARGDAAAASIIESAVTALAQALAAAVALLDPALIIVGGGFGTALDCSSGPLAARYRALTAGRPSPPPLERARLGEQSGLIGAALAAMADRGADQAAGDEQPIRRRQLRR
jgi:glucokinase